MMVPRLSGFTTQTTQLMPGCSSSWPNFKGWVLPGVNRSCRSGEASPSRLSQNTCAVVTPKVSAPRPVTAKRRISGSTRGKRAISFTVGVPCTRCTTRIT